MGNMHGTTFNHTLNFSFVQPDTLWKSLKSTDMTSLLSMHLGTFRLLSGATFNPYILYNINPFSY